MAEVWLGGNPRDEWLTPKYIIDALGPFDLDPCAPVVRPWPTAARHLTTEDDGLAAPWEGFVWMNPPYGPCIREWVSRLADHGNGIALIFTRLDSAWFLGEVWKRATALVFLNTRISFFGIDGRRSKNNGGSPSVLVAFGDEAAARLSRADLNGVYVDRWVA